MKVALRLHFQKRPWDLYIALGYSVVLGLLILAQDRGLIAAILLVIFAPGYVLVAALLPDDEGIDWIERIALSFGLSIAIVALLGLLLNFTPFGIFLRPVVVSILIFTAGVGVAAHTRRMQLPVEKRLSATISIESPSWQEFSSLERALAVGLGLSIIFASSVLVYVATTPGPGEQFTEFFILGPGGKAGSYPTDLNVSEEGTVIIGVVNHEFDRLDYTVITDRVEVVVVRNETGGFNETVEVGSPITMAWFNLTLDHESNWTLPYAFSIDAPGLWKLRLLLFRDGDLATVYRSLHLFVTVTAG